MDMGNDDFLRGLFDDIDEDGSGVLDRGEIAELARKLLGVFMPPAACRLPPAACRPAPRRAASCAALDTGKVEGGRAGGRIRRGASALARAETPPPPSPSPVRDHRHCPLPPFPSLPSPTMAGKPLTRREIDAAMACSALFAPRPVLATTLNAKGQPWVTLSLR